MVHFAVLHAGSLTVFLKFFFTHFLLHSNDSWGSSSPGVMDVSLHGVSGVTPNSPLDSEASQTSSPDGSLGEMLVSKILF